MPELWHFVYKLSGSSQFIMPAECLAFPTRKAMKQLLRQYQHVHERISNPKRSHEVRRFRQQGAGHRSGGR